MYRLQNIVLNLWPISHHCIIQIQILFKICIEQITTIGMEVNCMVQYNRCSGSLCFSPFVYIVVLLFLLLVLVSFFGPCVLFGILMFFLFVILDLVSGGIYWYCTLFFFIDSLFQQFYTLLFIFKFVYKSLTSFPTNNFVRR